jgi:acetyl-CoA carboxylase biotin carboxyl carrier protein
MATEVRAHITGTVWKIETSVGAKVKEGDVLVILESMKMEMPIEAPCDGTVRDVKIKETEAVDEGKVVVILDES